MKTLYLVRHAKAISRNRPVPDFERCLRKRGRKDARQIARAVAQLGPAPDVILSSPARRAIETAHLFAEAWNYPIADIATHKVIYDQDAASGDVLLPIVRALEPSSLTVMIVGHDPLFSTLAHFLDKNFTDWLPTCGVVCLTLKVRSWADVAHNSGTVRFFYSPKHEDLWLQPSADEIASQLTDQLHRTLAAWHPDVATMMQTSLRQTGTKVARQFVERLQTVQAEQHQSSR